MITQYPSWTIVRRGALRLMEVHFDATRQTQFTLWRWPTAGEEDMSVRILFTAVIRAELRAGRSPWSQSRIDLLVACVHCLLR